MPSARRPTSAKPSKPSPKRERRHKAELLALEAQMQANLEALTRINEGLTRRLDRANAGLGR